MNFILLSLTFLLKYIISETTPWDYDHMATWSIENPFCGAVDESPINIDTTSIITNDKQCTLPFNWNLDFSKTLFKIKNNGHSISLNAVAEPVSPEGEWTTLSSTTNVIGRFTNYFASKNSLIKEFCLDGVHFHWGTDDVTGSEHTIDGKQFPLEAHFVHFACNRLNIQDTLAAYPNRISVATVNQKSDAHELAIISVIFDVSDEINPAFDSIFTGDSRTLKLIEFEYKNNNITAPAPGEIVTANLDELLPANLTTAGYYTYEGSLTTPPCTDIVRWYVMNARGVISATQLEDYFRPLQKDNITAIAPNFRDTQIQNSNPVFGCFSDNNNDGKYNGNNAFGNDEYSHVFDDNYVSSHRSSFVMIGSVIIVGVTFIIIGVCIRSEKFKVNKYRKDHIAVDYNDDSEDESNNENELKYDNGRTNNADIMEVNSDVNLKIVTGK